ncbi:hypothetical protein P2H44_08510 [Albimonas sp. CAU 1670]|uniref:hypothetical protein n=1 Tax=Albimonas sp. CAU 1670 TaxID=3032599 RepID=UPI0023DC8CD7|nr:hypothetical protein [Albimonas sp. CAU 1670]MDF2232591.1 hypothetical protein [Albimonas sp. CAU 1670]
MTRRPLFAALVALGAAAAASSASAAVPLSQDAQAALVQSCLVSASQKLSMSTHDLSARFDGMTPDGGAKVAGVTTPASADSSAFTCVYGPGAKTLTAFLQDDALTPGGMDAQDSGD